MAYGKINYEIDFSKSEAKLRDVFGDKPIPPTEMTKRLWNYIKKNNIGKKTQ